MTFHPPTNRLVLYGGDAGSNETWTFQGLQWSQVTPATNPPAFFGHRMSTDPTTGTVWMHDGASRATWSWNGLDWTASPVLNQTARFDFGFGHDGSGPLVAGGTMQFDNAPTGDTWQLQNGTWIHHMRYNWGSNLKDWWPDEQKFPDGLSPLIEPLVAYFQAQKVAEKAHTTV